jgi:hypothetical protein
LLVAFNVAAGQEGLNHFGTFGVFGNQAVFGFLVNYKGFVKAGFYAVVYFSLYVFA